MKGFKNVILGTLLLASTCFGAEKINTASAGGFGGKVTVEVTTEGEKIKDLKVVSHKETAHIMDRAFPILKERILEAQSPIIDSVSGASFTSFAVKKAVADVLKKEGKDFGRITFKTKAPEQPAMIGKTVNTDIVIIGGGPAGLAAAISAKEAGADKVTIVEKLDILSGNGKFDMNFFDMINSKAQKANGIKDSVEAFIKDKSNPRDTAERTRVQAEGAYVLDEWLRGMGINLNYNYGLRNHMAEADAYAGAHIQDGLERKVKELGVDVRTGTKGLDFIMENGKVTGVKVQKKNLTYDINAKAVIVATGGFSANKALLAKYAPGSEKVETSNQLGATGDFVPVFEKNGMKMENMEVLSVFKMIISKTRDLTGAGDGFVLVNKNGERFIDETKSGLPMAYTILEQPESKVFYIYDQNLYESAYRLKKHVAQGLHTKADTLEELAEKLEIPKDKLVATIDTFNKGVRGEVKDPFREKAFTREFKNQGPYYGVQVESAIHMTKGGVAANEKAEVLYENGEIVEGLYAAGEVTNTSAAYSGAVIFGRVAGESAAKFVKNKK
ncbi:FAD-binding protein [uncultured Fusobacterium sp.]|uniref:FAD-binding protein n=1 Tax=uncultured Fusobacterium sp. TaxID=159267 RepID=UPI0025E2B8ED|nr:FAD-binding protein [uncultured Fusobacterium sp.]